MKLNRSVIERIAVRCAIVLLVVTVARTPAVLGQALPGAPSTNDSLMDATVPPDATEQQLVDKIKLLGDPMAMSQDANPVIRLRFMGEAPNIRLAYVEALLDRFPNTAFKEEAAIARMEALEILAITNPKRMAELAARSKSVPKNASPRLREVSAFYAIRAFQLSAQYAGASLENWLPGALRRYEDFAATFPNSRYMLAVYSYWARDLMKATRQLDAQDIVNKMAKRFPNEDLTRLSLDRVEMAGLIGSPYNVSFETIDGKPLKSAEYAGKILVIDYWMPGNRQSLGAMTHLIRLYTRYHHTYNLEIIGVTLSKNRAKIDEAMKTFMTEWPQCVSETDLTTNKPVERRFRIVPGLIIVGPDGKVTDVVHTVDDIRPKIEDAIRKFN